jgi:hypothetical protein
MIFCAPAVVCVFAHLLYIEALTCMQWALQPVPSERGLSKRADMHSQSHTCTHHIKEKQRQCMGRIHCSRMLRPPACLTLSGPLNCGGRHFLSNCIRDVAQQCFRFKSGLHGRACESTEHGGHSARRASGQRALGLLCVMVFKCMRHLPGPTEGPRKADFKHHHC